MKLIDIICDGDAPTVVVAVAVILHISHLPIIFLIFYFFLSSSISLQYVCIRIYSEM